MEEEKMEEDFENKLLFVIKIMVWLIVFLMIFGLVQLFIPRNTIKYAVTNYEWFYDQYNVIQSMQSNIKTLENKKLSERQEIELQGMKLVLNNNISEYNSKSRQITRELFKAKDLPYQINLEEK